MGEPRPLFLGCSGSHAPHSDREGDAIVLDDPVDLLALHEALEKLQCEDPVKAELVKLRFFAGLTVEQAGELLGISRATADRYWTFARAWLFHELNKGSQVE